MRVLTGMAIGLDQLSNITFDPHKSFVCCRICGKVFQSVWDRKETSLVAVSEAYRLRRNWADKHSKLHPESQHEFLRQSGLFCTPEAANKLAAFGVIDLEQLTFNPEYAAAYAESSPIPTDDAEGG